MSRIADDQVVTTTPEPSPPAEAPRARRSRPLRLDLRVLLAAAAAVLTAAVVTAGTDQVAPVVVVVLAVMVAAHASRLGWRLALAVVLPAAMVAELLFAWAAPHGGWSLATDHLVAWTLAGLAHALLMATRPPALGRRRLLDLVAVLAAPTTVGAYLLLAAQRDGAPWVSWGMAGDTANNIILSRQLIEEGGLLRSQGNAAPLSTVVYGAWGAPGFDALSYPDAVLWLITSGAQIGVLIWMAVGVVASAIALRAPGGPVGRRLLVGTVAGLLPFFWFTGGMAFGYGYQNGGPAALLLILAWLCWRERERHPVAGLTGLVLCTWAAATAWGPVAAIPALLMFAALVTGWRAWRAAGWMMLVPGLTFVAAGVYAFLVTRSDVSANSRALAFDGAHPFWDYWRMIWIVAIVVGLAVVFMRRVPAGVVIGSLVGVAGGAFALQTLLRARTDVGAEAWGYYPVKFSWIVMSVFVMVFFGEIQGLTRRLGRRLWGGTGVTLALVAAYTMMFQMSAPWRPVTLNQVVSPVAWHDATVHDPKAALMLRLMERSPKSILSRYSATGQADDSYINFWMIQMGAATTSDPVRGAAYTMNPDDAASVCTTIVLWGGDVTVWTRDPGFREELAAACDPRYPYEVVLRGGGKPA